MRMTIVADDKSITINQEFFNVIDMPELPANFHAMQWYETFGEVEFKSEFQEGKLVKPENQIIDSLDDYGWAITKHAAAKKAYEESLAAMVTDNYGWGTPPTDGASTTTTP